jgi:negative regulator of flagellin synthesis FlgM
MKITHNKIGQSLNIIDTSRSEKASKAAKAEQSIKDAGLDTLGKMGEAESSAKINLSEKAQMMNKAKEIAKGGSDIDNEKVQRLQKLIDEGKYKTDARAIADRLVDEELKWS